MAVRAAIKGRNNARMCNARKFDARFIRLGAKGSENNRGERWMGG